MSSFDAKKVAEIHQQLHTHLPSDSALRVKALETLLVNKGLVKSATIDAWVAAYTEDIGPMRGAKIVAKAWCEPDFKQRLLSDAPSAIDELGYLGSATGHLNVIENTNQIHNIVVCTLCSCYPFSILGIAPSWYKLAAYRSRVVRDPRSVLTEFGVEVPLDIDIRVWDSTAELRYMVLPQRPKDTADFTQNQLAVIVTRNSMIGTQRNLDINGVA